MFLLAPLGRIFYSLIFIMASFNHFTQGGIQYAQAMGVPQADLLVPISGIIALVGGLSILLGYKTRIGGLLIIIFLVPVSLWMHQFWGLPDPQAAQMQMIHFMKNLSMLGGACLITYFGAGPVSIDNRG